MLMLVLHARKKNENAAQAQSQAHPRAGARVHTAPVHACTHAVDKRARICMGWDGEQVSFSVRSTGSVIPIVHSAAEDSLHGIIDRHVKVPCLFPPACPSLFVQI